MNPRGGDPTIQARPHTRNILQQLASVVEYAGRRSLQSMSGDMLPASGAGSSTSSSPKFLGGVMGNIIGDSLTRISNYLAGVIGHYSITGPKATTYPTGAVLAGISDGVTECDGAVVAYIDGDSSVTKAGAAFKVRKNNSTPGSDFDFGIDLFDAAHDGYSAPGYAKGELRMLQEVVQRTGSGAPIDGVTGAGVTGKGSLYIDATGGEVYINTGTKAAPTWKLITHA